METQPAFRGFSLFAAVANQTLPSHLFYFFSFLFCSSLIICSFYSFLRPSVGFFYSSSPLCWWWLPLSMCGPQSCLWTDLNGWLLQHFNYAFALSIVVPIIVFSQTDIKHDETLGSRRVGCHWFDLEHCRGKVKTARWVQETQEVHPHRLSHCGVPSKTVGGVSPLTSSIGNNIFLGLTSSVRFVEKLTVVMWPL